MATIGTNQNQNPSILLKDLWIHEDVVCMYQTNEHAIKVWLPNWKVKKRGQSATP